MTLKELEPMTSGRDIKFKVSHLPSAFGDAAMIRHVWANLIDNAVKFTGRKADALIEVGALSNENETVYFVRDNGVGFDMRFADKLFGVFNRLHGADFPGNGAGLAIVQRIVSRNGGRVWAESKLDEGATFYFTLPASEMGHDQGLTRRKSCWWRTIPPTRVLHPRDTKATPRQRTCLGKERRRGAGLPVSRGRVRRSQRGSIEGRAARERLRLPKIDGLEVLRR